MLTLCMSIAGLLVIPYGYHACREFFLSFLRVEGNRIRPLASSADEEDLLLLLQFKRGLIFILVYRGWHY